MKNFNLCIIILIFGSFLFMHNSCHANITSSVVNRPPNLTEIVPDGDTDPDWLIFIGHYKSTIDRTKS
jgi:hypothetical protein